MSRLILKGDTVENLGRYIPAAHVDKVLLTEDGFDVTIGVFVNNTENDDNENYQSFIQDTVWVYLLIARDISEDNMAGDARLLGIKLFFNTNAKNDA